MRRAALFFLLICILITGCKKEKDPVFDPGTDGFINDWVLDSLKVYYYWNKSLPKKPNYNQDPLSFFNSIKNQQDRFSLLVNPDVPQSYKPALSAVFGIDLITFKNLTDQQTVVSLVVPGTEADRLGIKRGDRVTTINSTTPSESNITAEIENSIARGHLTLEIAGRPAALEITGTTISEGPVYTYKIINSGDKNVGYVFLNSFQRSGISKLQQAFDYFQSHQVNELILDLRYNSGGEVAVAAWLSALIGTSINEADVFAQYKGNTNVGSTQNSFEKEINRIPASYGTSFSLLRTQRLNISRVFLLTGKHTTSAAELLANNLTPYFPVTRIGERTLGKDMASFEIKDNRTPVQITKWSIHPLVYKLYNSKGAGDYSDGLNPDFFVDELDIIPLVQLGDERDPLVKKAIDIISGRAAKTVAQTTPTRILHDSRNKIDELSGAVQILR